MSYTMRRLLNHLPIPFGMRSDRVLRTTRMKHAQFACFLEESGFRSGSADHYDRSLRRRRLAKGLIIWATAFAAAWVFLESARAVMIM
ncbi:MAG: hypothetical protein JNG83_14425 [Opitutaceae bacterium]|nr:hypothetical protein [Opitutaceae bacterium]